MADDTEDTTPEPNNEDTMVADEVPGHKLMENNDDHYLIQDPDGGVFKVGKDLVSGLTKKKIESMPQVKTEPTQDDLGVTIRPDELTQQSPIGTPPIQPAVAMSNTQGTNAPPAAFVPVSDMNPEVVPQGTQMLPNAQGQQQPPPSDNPMAGSFNDMRDTIKEQSKAQELLNVQQAGARRNELLRQEAIKNQYDTEIAANAIARKKAAQDYGKGEIKPYWSDVGMPNKIGAALAIMLGGIAGGLTGKGGNIALDVITKNMDRDLEMQKANINKKGTYLRDLMDQGHDLNSAYAMARSNQYAQTQALLENYIAQSQSPTVKLNGQMALMALEQKAKESDAQIAQMRMAQGYGAGQVMSVNPEMIRDQELKDRIVQLGNGKSVAVSSKSDVEPVKKGLTLHKTIMDSLDELETYNKQAFHGNLSPHAIHRMEQLQGNLASDLAQSKGYVRFNPELNKALMAGIKKPDTVGSALFGSQIAEMKKDINNSMQSMLTHRIQGYRPPPEIKKWDATRHREKI